MDPIGVTIRNAVTNKSTGFTVHDYVDILEKQKRQYDAFFALKSWRPKPVLYPEATKSITDKIINSPRMKDTIIQLLHEGHSSYEDLIAQAKSILEEMGHTYSLGTVRVIGFFLSKLIRQLYLGIAINNCGVLKLSNAMSQGPVLILPTHRSYADFLLISYLCFTLDIPLPVIAAGMDFKGMKFVNRILQNAGAFYIRRSFGQDRLYWSAVSEYIQYQIMNFQAPIEFFLEGTRSRNGKSLPPKTGLLTMALEPYLKGDVPDIQICTISISYERTLEENLYAYEILGIPKPRESTSGFLSAVDKIRGQNYGRIYLNVSDPISVRDHLSKRTEPNWNMPSFRFTLSEHEKSCIHSLAHILVCKQQKEAITPVSAIVMSALSVNLQLNVEQLVDHVVLFNSLLFQHGTPTFCFSKGDDVIQFVHDCLDVHKLVICASTQGYYSCQLPITQIGDLHGRAAARLVLQQYTNQLLGPLINVAIFRLITEKFSIDTSEIMNESLFFAKYFKDEFVLIHNLTQSDLLLMQNTSKTILNILSTLLQPYLETFYIILQIIVMGVSTIKDIQMNYRLVVNAGLTEGASNFPEILAIDKVPRHVLNLVANGHLYCVKKDGITKYHIVDDISSIITKLEPYVDQRLTQFIVSHRKKSVLLQSQL